MKVLLVEDEALPGMLLVAMLSDLGHEVVGPIDSFGPALAAARDVEVDIAVLDVNLRGGFAFRSLMRWPPVAFLPFSRPATTSPARCSMAGRSRF